MSEPHGELKGGAIVWTLKFIDARFGGGARERVLSRLAPEDRDVLNGIVLSISWYPLPLFARLLHAMDDELGAGDLSLAKERGTWVAMEDVKTIHRVLLRLFTPQWVVERATGQLWRKFHSSGDWKTEDLGGNHARASLDGLAHVDAAVCESIAGWIVGLFRLAGSKVVEVRHTACRARGAPSCIYDVTWG